MIARDLLVELRQTCPDRLLVGPGERQGPRGPSSPERGQVPSAAGLGHNGARARGRFSRSSRSPRCCSRSRARVDGEGAADEAARAGARRARNSPAASSALAVDLATGQTLFARNPDARSRPRRTRSCSVLYTALVELGVTYRFRTAVLSVGHQEGIDVARERLPEGLRRSDADVAAARAARRAAEAAGDHAHRRSRPRRRIVVRLGAHRAGLEVGVLPHRVAAALGARRRPRGLRRPPGAAAALAAAGPLPAAAAQARDHGALRRARPRAGVRVRPRSGRVGAVAGCSRRWASTATTSSPSSS